MIALDTNVLVRFITQDDSEQTPLANALIERPERFFIPDLVLAEIVWVLTRAYQWSREEITQTLDHLMTANNLKFEDEEAVALATRAYRKGGDWADHLILFKARSRECSALYTFDQELAHQYPEFAKSPGRE